MDLTPDQIQKLKALGIEVNDSSFPSSPEKNDLENNPKGIIESNTNQPKNPSILTDITKSPTINETNPTNNHVSSNNNFRNSKLDIKHSHSNIFPLLSISGLTILSFSGLILFKNKDQDSTKTSDTKYDLPQTSVSPTQVPKSIQHYLLTSQQYFTQASQNQDVEALNQSIIAATSAIKDFPQDYRGFYQRGRIYQSVLTSKPELITQVIADLSQAQKLSPENAEITRSLASAYAQKGDAQNTINYLSQTIALEPTKAQNFYDLAKIQQQVGLLPQALETYDKLITLVSDSAQKAQVQSEKSSIEKLISQNPQAVSTNQSSTPIAIPTTDLPSSLEGPTIQASTSGGLIVAAPEEINQVKVSNLSTSNSLSGSSILPTNQKEITLQNDLVSSTSQVYLTVTKGGKNQNLQVLSKTEKSFTVGLDSPILEDIEFKWWIIN